MKFPWPITTIFLYIIAFWCGCMVTALAFINKQNTCTPSEEHKQMQESMERLVTDGMKECIRNE